MSNSLMQFVKFGLVGFLNTVITYLVYFVLVLYNFHYLLANIAGFIAGVLNAYYWSDKYVFKLENGVKRDKCKTVFKTFASYGITGLLFTSVMLLLFVDYFEWSKYYSQLLCLSITVPLNFVLNKYWSFANK